MATTESLPASVDEAFKALDTLAKFFSDASAASGFHSALLIEDLVRPMSSVERTMLIVTECAEITEAFRKSNDPADYYFREDGKPEGAASEVIDVIIRAFDYMGLYFPKTGLKPSDIIRDKAKFNATRETLHGKVL